MSDLFGGLILISAGTLYPAYSSYKAVKTKNTREYVKWMMYWIVFAFFNAITLFTDIFISWFPGYYLFKTLFIIWLVSPATRGSTYLYKKVLHPTLRANEEKIDKTISNIKERGYDYSSQYARLAMQNFSRTLMEAVFRGQVMIADQMQRQYMQNSAAPVVQTDGRETDHLSRSSAPLPPPQFPQDDQFGRLYRVDSQMFEMDDEFVELSADVSGDRPEQMVVEEYDENGNPIQVISSEVVYTEDHMMGQHHGITSQQDHFTHATSSADPYSQYTEENSFEMQEYDEFVPPPQSAARQRRRAHKSRSARPVSMPPPTIEEISPSHHLEDEVQSDPDYSPDPPRQSSKKKPKPQRRHTVTTISQKLINSKSGKREAPDQRRVTRSSARMAADADDDDDDLIE